MHPAAFQTAVPARKWRQMQALDRVTTEIGCNIEYLEKQCHQLLNITTQRSVIIVSVLISFNQIFISLLQARILLIYLE
jgi:hypothetical protein